MKEPVLYVVVPCYNEEEVLPETNKRLCEKIGQLIDRGLCHKDSKILYVDDGSRDKTWEIIEDFHNQNNMVSGVKLAHNRGHQNALLAGLMTAKDLCDCAASMDADLQDDINVLDGFLEKFSEGCEIVYGVRSKRDTDTAFKRITAEGFYKILDLFGVEVVFNHADCRLMSKRALDELAKYKEVNLFLRGIVPSMGFKHDTVYFERSARFAGESKYPLKKMLGLALDGVTSFSVKPLKLITSLGITLSVIALLGFLALLIVFICGVDFGGWLVVLCAAVLLSGMQTVCIGIVGEYIGKIYAETKARPRFGIEKFLK